MPAYLSTCRPAGLPACLPDKERTTNGIALGMRPPGPLRLPSRTWLKRFGWIAGQPRSPSLTIGKKAQADIGGTLQCRIGPYYQSHQATKKKKKIKRLASKSPYGPPC